MAYDESAATTIERLASAQDEATDDEVLARIESLAPLADETDPCWDAEDYWQSTAYPFLALADVAAKRRLRRAVRPLLERACYGDPGETMRGLRHTFEAIYNPDWSGLADEYLAVARAERLGTRMWAIASLMVVDDPRAASAFEASVREDPEDISWYAAAGLERLRRDDPAAI